MSQPSPRPSWRPLLLGSLLLAASASAQADLDQLLDAARCHLGEAQGHGPPRRAGEAMAGRFPEDRSAVTVGDDQARILRKDIDGHAGVGGKE